MMSLAKDYGSNITVATGTMTYFSVFLLRDLIVTVTAITKILCVIKGCKNVDCTINCKQEDNIGGLWLTSGLWLTI